MHQVSNRQANQAVSGAPSVLGRIESNCLILDDFKVPIPLFMKPVGMVLNDGDRVLVAPVKGGDEFVVVCVIESNRVG
jgi:hypothetical protein